MSKKEKTIGCLAVWKPEKNFGFVHVMNEDDSVASYFLHAVNVYSGNPAKGSIVRFEPAKSPKGLRCTRAEIFQNRREMDIADAADEMATLTGGVS